MSLSKIVQESVDETLEKVYEEIVCEDIGYEDFKSFFISSQISLLEAELERKKGMIQEITRIDYKVGSGDRKYWQNELIQEDIVYLEEQIEECRKLLK